MTKTAGDSFPGYTLDNMYRPTSRITLQGQNAWSFRIIRVFLNHMCVSDTFNDIPCKNLVFREFIIPMGRDFHITCKNQLPDSLEDTDHRDRVSHLISFRQAIYCRSQENGATDQRRREATSRTSSAKTVPSPNLLQCFVIQKTFIPKKFFNITFYAVCDKCIQPIYINFN